MLNFPKTGSSYVRSIIKKIHRKRGSALKQLIVKIGLAQKSITEYILPKIDEQRHAGYEDQHGTYRQIPEKYKNKKIVSIVRHPCERYVSTYLFRWWEKFPPANRNEIESEFPNFPDLNFKEYYEMMHRFGRWDRIGGNSLKSDIGLQSIQFVQFYFKNPQKILQQVCDGNFKSIKESEEMAKIEFLHQENLNHELKLFLLQCGYSKKDVRLIDNSNRINVTKRSANQKEMSSVIPFEVHKKIVEREALLFFLFPEYSAKILHAK